MMMLETGGETGGSDPRRARKTEDPPPTDQTRLTIDQLDDDCSRLTTDRLGEDNHSRLKIDRLGDGIGSDAHTDLELTLAGRAGNPHGRATEIHNKYQALQTCDSDDGDGDEDQNKCSNHDTTINAHDHTTHTELHKSKNLNRRHRMKRQMQTQHQQSSDQPQSNDHNTTMNEHAFEDVVRDAAVMDKVCQADWIGLPTSNTTTRQKHLVKFYTHYNSTDRNNDSDSNTTDKDIAHDSRNNNDCNMAQDTGARVHCNCSSRSPNCSFIICERVRPNEWSSREEEVQGLETLGVAPLVTKMNGADGQRKLPPLVSRGSLVPRGAGDIRRTAQTWWQSAWHVCVGVYPGAHREAFRPVDKGSLVTTSQSRRGPQRCHLLPGS